MVYHTAKNVYKKSIPLQFNQSGVGVGWSVNNVSYRMYIGGGAWTFTSNGDGVNRTRLRYSPSVSTWNFENSTVTINNTPVLINGSYGLGTIIRNLVDIDTLPTENGFSIIATSTTGNKPFTGTALTQKRTAVSGSILAFSESSDRIAYRRFTSSTARPWQELINTANSTVDSNGFYKKASPILRLFANEDIEAVGGFEKSGCGLVNSEAKGVTATRIDIGHYEIHGSFGFAKEGWYIEQPKDANGNVFSFVEYSTDENNVITVKTYTKKFDYETCNIVAGESVDIKEGRWIDLRLEMPVVEIDEPILPIASTFNPVTTD